MDREDGRAAARPIDRLRYVDTPSSTQYPLAPVCLGSEDSARGRKVITADTGTLVQIIAVTKTGDQGCRITVDGVVKVMQRPGNPHCIYTLR